ncbi:hypothetical protein RSAG8_09032, partial [Rhizoctonia solani AG-8 WAC10335]
MLFWWQEPCLGHMRRCPQKPSRTYASRYKFYPLHIIRPCDLRATDGLPDSPHPSYTVIPLRSGWLMSGAAIFEHPTCAREPSCMALAECRELTRTWANPFATCRSFAAIMPRSWAGQCPYGHLALVLTTARSQPAYSVFL